MKNIKLSGSVLLVTTLSFAGVVAANTAIEGRWQCLMTYQGATAGSGEVSFDKNGQCVMGGQPFTYKLLAGNTLQISNGSMTDSYTYQLQNNTLTLNYRDGSSFVCDKQTASATPGGLLNRPGKTQSAASGSGNEWQLNGTFCHYSGSSSYGSSYSSTSRISFDGQGRWSMGSEASFSGDAGSAYSGGGVDNSGTYRINGGQVTYTTRDGEQGALRINMQQSDGRITEFYLGDSLYAPSLCN